MLYSKGAEFYVNFNDHNNLVLLKQNVVVIEQVLKLVVITIYKANNKKEALSLNHTQTRGFQKALLGYCLVTS